MKRFTMSCLIALMAIIVGAPRASAATSQLDVQITFTIAAVVSVEWAGGYSGTGTVTWAVGGVALNSNYETLTPTNGSGGSWTDNLRITNTSTTTNSSVDIELVLQSGPAIGWTAAADGTPLQNVFAIRAKPAAASAADLLTTGSIITTAPTADFIAGLAPSTNSAEIDFLFRTPTTITTGAGSAQSITLRFTASVAN